MRSLSLILLMIMSSCATAASDCQLAFDDIRFFDQTGTVDWKEGKALEKSYPELTTLTPEIPEKIRIQIQYRGSCKLEAQVRVFVFGLKGAYASGDDPHHEAHGKAPEGSEWTSESLWSHTSAFNFPHGKRSFSFADIPAESILLSAPEGSWYWALKFKIEIREKGKEQLLWQKTQELSAPLVH